MTLVKNKSKQQQMWQNKTVLADEPEDKRPELAPIAMLFTIINAVLCLISLLLAFVPVHIEKSIINEPTIPNLIGVINRDLGVDFYRMDGATHLILFAAAVLLIAVGVVTCFYRDRAGAFFTLSGSVMLLWFIISWIYMVSDENAAAAKLEKFKPLYEDVAVEKIRVLRAAMLDTGLPYFLLVFAALSIISSLLAVFFYTQKSQGE